MIKVYIWSIASWFWNLDASGYRS